MDLHNCWCAPTPEPGPRHLPWGKRAGHVKSRPTRRVRGKEARSGQRRASWRRPGGLCSPAGRGPWAGVPAEPPLAAPAPTGTRLLPQWEGRGLASLWFHLRVPAVTCPLGTWVSVQISRLLRHQCCWMRSHLRAPLWLAPPPWRAYCRSDAPTARITREGDLSVSGWGGHRLC